MDSPTTGQTFLHAMWVSTELCSSNVSLASSVEPGPSALHGTPSVPGMAKLPGLGPAPVARMPLRGGRGDHALGWEHEPSGGAVMPVGQWGSSPASGSEGPVCHSNAEQQHPSVPSLRLEVGQRWAHLLHTLEAIRAAPPLMRAALPAAAPFPPAVLLPPCAVRGWAGGGPAGLMPQEGSVCSRTSC